MDNSKLPKGQSQESQGGGKPRNLPGIYRHEGAKKEIITSADPSDGSIQADALVRVGYRRIADVPSRVEINKMREAQLAKTLAEEKANKLPKAQESPETPINGTSSKSNHELEEELAQTKATLEALKAGSKAK